MNPTEASKATTVRVGLFTLFGLALVGAFTVFVNDKPYWWRKCEPVYISVEDATGLKTKSPIRSLGLQVGYLHSVELTETRVKLGVCITAPIEILPDTRAYIRGEGFLGDKFVELKPVRYVGEVRVGPREHHEVAPPAPAASASPSATTSASTTSANENRRPGSVAKGAKKGNSLLRNELSREENLDPKKALEAKPVEIEKEVQPDTSELEKGSEGYPFHTSMVRFLDLLVPSARAEDVSNAKEVPVGSSNRDMDKLIEQSNKLMIEMTDLTKNLKEGLQPKELRETIQQLNKTLQSAGKALSPEGGLNSTARRALEKLEKAFEAMQAQMERINRGEGSVGRILNDPVYADEALKAMKNLNKLLNKAADILFMVRLGAEQLPAYDGGRGYFQLQIFPNPTRYYLIGVTIDPRGRRTVLNTTTTSNGQSTAVSSEQIEEGGLLLTGMFGKVFWNRFDVAAGALHSDGAVSIGLHLGPVGSERMFTVRNDIYVRGQGVGLNDRLSVIAQPFLHNDFLGSLFVEGGLESFRKYNGKTSAFFGGGVTFSDDDIKLLFAFK
ncbi:MAG: MCE family protein [Bdellovibrionales bacterium]|nr:MCE family protein [Bdellovibrionales bacterium]